MESSSVRNKESWFNEHHASCAFLACLSLLKSGIDNDDTLCFYNAIYYISQTFYKYFVYK